MTGSREFSESFKFNAIPELVKPARFLHNAAPLQFNEFVAAFAAYTHQQIMKLVVTGELVQITQGHAQQCAKILKTLEEVKNG